jgi:hypothetical protein
MTRLKQSSVGVWGVPIFKVEGASESLDELLTVPYA